MKIFEILKLSAEPFLPVLPAKVRSELKSILKKSGNQTPVLLDAGGRKSSYTIGISARIVICDKPRESETQKKLGLGITPEIAHRIKKQRSNISEIIFHDLALSPLTGKLFDGVVCVEVIEHVWDDEKFIKNIFNTIKPGGFLYLTTPNGDYVKNEPPNFNPDHKRHYKKIELENLIKKYFTEADVYYGIKTGRYRFWGLRSFSLKKPFQLIWTMFANLINRIESRGLDEQASRTAHLFCLAFKKKL